MQFPDNKATELTERIMSKIKLHIIREEPPQENHHYNRVYEGIYSVLNEPSVREEQKLGHYRMKKVKRLKKKFLIT